MKINIKNAFLIVIAMNVFMACESTKNDTPETEPTESAESISDQTGNNQVIFTKAQYELAAISMGKTEKRSLSNLLKLNGEVEIEPSGIATLSAPLGGYLTTPALLPGEKVTKGQRLAVLEDPKFIELQQQYLESLGQLEYLEEEYKRQQKLRDQDVNSAKTFQKVSSDYKILQARIKGIEETLKLIGININFLKKGEISRKASVYSPINGFIKTSNFNLGNYVNPKDVLFEIVNTSELHVVLNAYEKDISQIQEGQELRFSQGNESGYKRKATVFLVGKASSDDRIVPVHCHIADGDQKGVLPGMYVKALVETNAAQQNTVPSEAIVKYNGNDFLIRLVSKTNDNYFFELVPIKTGTIADGYTAVEIPGMDSIEGQDWVVGNAYAIISAKINSEEE
ncbi:efflux RND transporter periplasmic adaptor subunit [uncultured Roseivirga sp.]|uniref:efflux RND transporter periplasmic adaptor subunit n=1 Tax=uncultured Roseivirga sp. TaxID=543088 RepID=UPI0030DDAE26|tara:strand:+ start:9927 stop:11117 length:1191 start_codon:yes stop_codon:yes gene_type:complete